MAKRSVSERFWAKVSPPDENGCRLWLAGTTTNGYGKFFLDGKDLRAHRASYLIHVGAIPDGLVLDHLCRTPMCVNPDHLEPVTQAENMRRGHWATKTHCTKGHPYSPENTYTIKRGWRYCRACR